MSMPSADVSHHLQEIAELKADRHLAREYLKAAMEAFGNPDERAGGLLALLAVAEAYGELGLLAAEAGMDPTIVSRALSEAGHLEGDADFMARNS